MPDKKPDAKSEEGTKSTPKEEASGGFKSWLPLITSVVLMPALAFATTKFLVLPKVVQARESGHGDGSGGSREASGKEAKAHDGKEGKESAKGHAAGKKKQSVPIAKVIVNVAGSAGSRYLMASFTLVGSQTDFKNVIEESKDQLLDLANTAMASKTITDLEKPGARNQLRAELISIFNNALGGNTVQEIYFTEFAVQ